MFEVGKRDGPIDLGRTSVAADGKLEAPLRRDMNVTFVEGTVVIHGDFGMRM